MGSARYIDRQSGCGDLLAGGLRCGEADVEQEKAHDDDVGSHGGGVSRSVRFVVLGQLVRDPTAGDTSKVA